jgi:hypothetical protein
LFWNYEKRSIESQQWPWRNHNEKQNTGKKSLNLLWNLRKLKLLREKSQLLGLQGGWKLVGGEWGLMDSFFTVHSKLLFSEKGVLYQYLWRLVGNL